MTETSLVSTLVDDHSILHIVTSIRDDSNDSVCTAGTLIKVIVLILQGTDKRCLREQNPVHFVVHTVRVSVVRRSHSLFCHLALIHVTGRLIVVTEGNGRCYNRQHIDWVNFLMGNIGSQIFFEGRDIECDLL